MHVDTRRCEVPATSHVALSSRRNTTGWECRSVFSEYLVASYPYRRASSGPLFFRWGICVAQNGMKGGFQGRLMFWSLPVGGIIREEACEGISAARLGGRDTWLECGSVRGAIFHAAGSSTATVLPHSWHKLLKSAGDDVWTSPPSRPTFPL